MDPNCPLKGHVLKGWFTRMLLLGISGDIKIWEDMKTKGKSVGGQKLGQQGKAKYQEGSGREEQIGMMACV